MDLGAVYLITWSSGLWVHRAEISMSVLDRVGGEELPQGHFVKGCGGEIH